MQSYWSYARTYISAINFYLYRIRNHLRIYVCYLFSFQRSETSGQSSKIYYDYSDNDFICFLSFYWNLNDGKNWFIRLIMVLKKYSRGPEFEPRSQALNTGVLPLVPPRWITSYLIPHNLQTDTSTICP